MKITGTNPGNLNQSNLFGQQFGFLRGNNLSYTDSFVLTPKNFDSFVLTPTNFDSFVLTPNNFDSFVLTPNN